MEGNSCAGSFSIAVPHDKTVTRSSRWNTAQAATTYAQNGDTGTCRAYPAPTLDLPHNTLIFIRNFLQPLGNAWFAAFNGPPARAFPTDLSTTWLAAVRQSSGAGDPVANARFAGGVVC